MNEPNNALESLRGLVVSDEEAARRNAAIDRRKAEAACATLRINWGAPQRHETTSPQREGPWAEKLGLIEQRIGTGCLFGIVGTRGNGKTQMAVEAMRTATGRLLTAHYQTAISVFSRIKATFRKDSKESEEDIVKALLKPKLLVLDEVGKRGESDWENNLFFSIVDKRYGDMTDTILVANLEPTAFGECIGASLASRMNQTGGFILADWPSRR